MQKNDSVNPVYYRTLRDIYAGELAMLPIEIGDDTPDWVVIPKGHICQEGPEGEVNGSVDIVYDHPDYLLVGDVTAWVAAADLEHVE